MYVSNASMVVLWNMSKTATCGPVLTDLYREVAAIQREAGSFREVAA